MAIPLITGLFSGISLVKDLFALKKEFTPVIEKVKSLEDRSGYLENTEGLSKEQIKNLINETKHKDLIGFIEPVLQPYAEKCGWNDEDVHTIVKFVVLISKKFIGIWKRQKRK
jgi:hypothetical protein